MRFKDETAFNAAVRGIFKTWGWGCIHVREADTPGVLDLVAWKPHRLGWPGQNVVWMELKIDDEAVRTSQLEFIRDNPQVSYVARWHTNVELIELTHAGKIVLLSWPQFAGWVSEI